MRPHPLFRNAHIPTRHPLGPFVLSALSTNDLDRDYAAVLRSAGDIKAANPGLTWPDGLTKAQNLIDLAWHQKEFQTRRSFAWIIEDAEGEYLGCLYVYPSLSGETAADVHWWWRTGAGADTAALRPLLEAWFSGGDWPALTYRMHGPERGTGDHTT